MLGATLCLAALFGYIVFGRHGASSPGAVGSSDDVRQSVARAFVSTDGRKVIVPVNLNLGADTSGRWSCTQAVLRAKESDRSVTLTLSVKPYDGFCVGGSGISQVAVTLRAPLFGRELRDAMSGKRVPYFGGRTLLKVGYLPPGYHLEQEALGTLSGSIFDPSSTATWTSQFFGPVNSPILRVVQSQSGVPAWATFPQHGTVVVHAHRAALRLIGPDDVAITWTDDGVGVAVLTQSFDPESKPLPRRELLAVAAGLHR